MTTIRDTAPFPPRTFTPEERERLVSLAGQYAASPDEQEALADLIDVFSTPTEWRSLDGIASYAGVPREQVEHLVQTHPDVFVQAPLMPMGELGLYGLNPAFVAQANIVV